MCRRMLGTVMKTLGTINSNAKRFYDCDDKFNYANFALGNKQYRMDKDGNLYRFNTDTFEYDIINPSWSKKGIYPEYSLGGSPIKAYVLSLALSDSSFYEAYMNDSSLVVNHTVTTESNKVFKDTYRGISRSKVKPTTSVAYNPAYLELVSNGDNVRHGAFVNKYGLYGVYVSAKDIDSLSKMMLNPDDFDESELDSIIQSNKSKVIEYYTKLGLTIDLVPTA